MSQKKHDMLRERRWHPHWGPGPHARPSYTYDKKLIFCPSVYPETGYQASECDIDSTKVESRRVEVIG